MDTTIVFCTVSSKEEAKKIAYSLIEKKLAACANIVNDITSVYSWKNEICEDNEFLLIIKTREEKFEELKKEILSLHSYELPEIIMIPITTGLPEYLNWIKKQT